jgi:DNA-directed RNA polymerase specialized sigma24 family protein
MRAEAARIAKLPDPVSIIKTVGDTFAALDGELERMAAVRLSAVRRLRDDGWSYDRIAAATGLSKGRVQQLSNDSRSR